MWCLHVGWAANMVWMVLLGNPTLSVSFLCILQGKRQQILCWSGVTVAADTKPTSQIQFRFLMFCMRVVVCMACHGVETAYKWFALCNLVALSSVQIKLWVLSPLVSHYRPSKPDRNRKAAAAIPAYRTYMVFSGDLMWNFDKVRIAFHWSFALVTCDFRMQTMILCFCR